MELRNSPHHLCLLVVCFLLLPTLSLAQSKSPLLTALEQELGRAMTTLTQKGDPPPYFISYHVTDNSSTRISASYGALNDNAADRSRTLDVSVRVGDYTLDNTHQIRGDYSYFDRLDYLGSIDLPIEDDIDAIKSKLWVVTDKRYKSAVERLIKVKANRTVKVREEDSSADFSREKPQTAVLPLVSLAVATPALEKRLRDYSMIFSSYPEIHKSWVMLTAESTNKYFVSTEGSSLQYGRTHLRIGIIAQTKADDGMELYRYEAFDVHTTDRLPDDSTVRRTIDEMVRDLLALRKAPVIEPFTGPAILSGRASAVFFHEIFGHRIEGHRQKDEEEGQTFTKDIGKPVLPQFISVYDDPTTKQLAGIDLNGYYEYDDEGVKAERVTVVKDGVLRNFLMSRAPVEGFEHSNGHGRKSGGFEVVGRQGNLIVQSSKSTSEEKLRKMLIDECKKQKKPFGLVFMDISGGFTFTGRGIPQAFQVTPIMVYRVYADGRPDELVRGVDLIGTPLTSFSKIMASGDKLEVFNGICGAESGWVPVSGVSPSILISQIEVQKKEKSANRPPLLPPPPVSGDPAPGGK